MRGILLIEHRARRDVKRKRGQIPYFRFFGLQAGFFGFIRIRW